MVQNRWTVFEYLKSRTLATGHVPDRKELELEFGGLDPEEIEGGIQEFSHRLGSWINDHEIMRGDTYASSC
ncbi:hypothetical protein MUG84_26610 [Paenibacillus sp. KQZ6P-2]|uniref:Uncharacterized protein n=1 Tax=Paenibacillus mangrovi TaxID=2931978 RepID=A0A9X1WWN1_9BACL|nr:hypothetical protein [Paenibacillus mangrovi]MCJ8015245.1 hypothetical protein [Paenibacillus mangrovi]